MLFRDLVDPTAVESTLAWLEEQERLVAGIREYPEFLALSVLETRTPEQQARFDKLAVPGTRLIGRQARGRCSGG